MLFGIDLISMEKLFQISFIVILVVVFLLKCIELYACMCVYLCVCVSLHPNVRPRSIFVVYYLFTCFPFLHSVSIVDPYFGASMVRRYVGTLVLGDLWGVHLQIFECFIFVIVPWDMSHPTPSHFHIVLYVVYLVWESRRKV